MIEEMKVYHEMLSMVSVDKFVIYIVYMIIIPELVQFLFSCRTEISQKIFFVQGDLCKFSHDATPHTKSQVEFSPRIYILSPSFGFF